MDANKKSSAKCGNVLHNKVNETFIFVLAKEMKYLAHRHGLHTVMTNASQTVAIISFSARGAYFILR